jgi:hypothetical protein
MDVSEEQQTLTLTGIFGHDRGKVAINGTELAITSWNVDKIVCTLPLTGPGAAGDVQVEVRQHKSNVRQLSEWKTVLKYDMDGPGTLRKHLEFNIRWRGDILPYRDKPGQEPKFREVPFDFTTDSVGSAKGNGTYSEGETTYSWSGEHLLPYFVGDTPIPEGSRGFIGNGKLKPETGQMELFFGGSGTGGGSSTIQRPNLPPINLPFSSYFPFEALPRPFTIPMQNDGVFPPLNKAVTTFTEPFVQLTAQGTITFDRIEPRFPPLPDTPRHR